VPSAGTLQQARHLVSQGFSLLDALHLATAQQANADWLITTDDRFLHIAVRKTKNRRPELINPIDWLQRRSP
jgi:predicted nucleic acid-binding protein